LEIGVKVFQSIQQRVDLLQITQLSWC
jgi:hypothetical protein